MEANLMKTLGQIAGIGGISLGVLLIVLRDIIRKNIFPKFKDEKLAFSLLRLIVIVVWVTAIAGIGAWVYTSVSGHKIADTISIKDAAFSGNIRFDEAQIIFNQYQQITGKPLEDEKLKEEIERSLNLIKGGLYKDAIPLLREIAQQVKVPAVYNNLGGLYTVTRNYESAQKTFKKAIERDPENQAVHHNLGLIAEKQGRTEDAIRHFNKASEPEASKKLSKKMEEKRKAGLIELESNNDIYSSNQAPLNKQIQGVIADNADVDFFTFTTPPTYRDIIKIEIENRSNTLKPTAALYDANKHKFWNNDGYYWTPGQNLSHSFVAGPDSKYHLALKGYRSAGDYQLSILPLKAYDRFEPNDNIHQAKDISIGEPINGHVMDGSDKDYYRFKKSSKDGNIVVSIENPSTTLKPNLALFNADKHKFWANDGYYWTPGQDLEHAFKAKADVVYYLAVSGYKSTGAYVLKLSEAGDKLAAKSN